MFACQDEGRGCGCCLGGERLSAMEGRERKEARGRVSRGRSKCIASGEREGENPCMSRGEREGYAWMLPRRDMKEVDILLIVFRHLWMIKHCKIEHESPKYHTGRSEPMHVRGRKRGHVWMLLRR